MVSQISSILSAVFLVAGVAVMLVVHILVVFWALRRGLGSPGDEERAEDSCAGGAAGLTADELSALPCHEYKGAADSGGDCAVCLEAFEAGDRCRRLPRCEHSFHAPCVDSWLRKSRLCPVCRADVVDQSPAKGEAKVAAAIGAVETVERRSPAGRVGD